MFASDLEMFLALYPHLSMFEISWPSGFKPDKFEGKAKAHFNLKQD